MPTTDAKQATLPYPPGAWSHEEHLITVLFPFAPGTLCPIDGLIEPVTGDHPVVGRYSEACDMDIAEAIADQAAGYWKSAHVYRWHPSLREYRAV